MTLVHPKPIGTFTVKNGKITGFQWLPNEENQQCKCGFWTKETCHGFPECSVCKDFETTSKCERCVFGVNRSTFVVGPTDLDDHVEHYTGCLIRDHWENLRDAPDLNSDVSAWGIRCEDREKCFYSKELFILDTLSISRHNIRFKLFSNLRVTDIPDLHDILVHQRDEIFTEKNIKSITSEWGCLEMEGIHVWNVHDGMKNLLLTVYERKFEKEKILDDLRLLRKDLGI